MPPPLDRLCYFNMNSEFTIKRHVHIPLMIHYLYGIIPPNIQQPVKQWHASSIVDCGMYRDLEGFGKMI